MAKFYIQTDKGLIKVGNDITLENIKAALGYTPSNFSGDFYDLTNNPFSNVADGEFNIVDENQNIIAIVDKDGIHSVEMTAKDSYNRVHKLTEKADLTDVTELETNINFNNLVDNPIIVDDKGEFVIEDESGNKGFILNKSGVKAKDFTTSDGVSLNDVDNRVNSIQGKVNDVDNRVDSIQGKVNDVDNRVNSIQDKVDSINEMISDDEEDRFIIRDGDGEVGLELNKNGLYVKDVTAGKNVLSKKADLDIVNKKLDKSEFTEIITVDETGEFVIEDEKGNAGLKLDSGGLTVINDVIIRNEKGEEEHKLSKKADLNDVNILRTDIGETIKDIESNIGKNKDDITNLSTNVNNITERIGVVEGRVDTNESNITNLSNTVNSNKSQINSIQGEVDSINEMISDAEESSFIVSDSNDYIGLKLNQEGLHVKDVITYTKEGKKEHVLSDKANQSSITEINKTLDDLNSTVKSHKSQIDSISDEVDNKLDKSTFEEVINKDTSNTVKVLYDGENVGLTVSASGISASGDVIAYIDSDSDSDTVFHKLSEKANQSDLNTLTSTVELNKKNIDNKLDKSTFEEVINTETSDTVKVLYDGENVGLTVSASGISTSGDVIADGHKLKEKANQSDLEGVDKRLSDIETLLDEDSNDIIDNIRDVIDYFENVSESEVGSAFIDSVSKNTENIKKNAYDINQLSEDVNGRINSLNAVVNTHTSNIKSISDNISLIEDDVDSINDMISDAEESSFIVSDSNDYIGLKLDKEGLHVNKDVITYTKEGEKEHKLSEKANQSDVDAISVITSANASVDSNVGTPSVTVSLTGDDVKNKTLNFEFKNLKGVKGEIGYGIFYTNTEYNYDTTSIIKSDIIDNIRTIQVGDLVLSSNGNIFSVKKVGELLDVVTVEYLTSIKGPKGVGILNIEKVDSNDSDSDLIDTYNIIYTDDNKEPDTFTVTNGKDGASVSSISVVGNLEHGSGKTNTYELTDSEGNKLTGNIEVQDGVDGIGIKDITKKDSSDSDSDLVDTYTITYTDDEREPYDFYVTNGKDGYSIFYTPHQIDEQQIAILKNLINTYERTIKVGDLILASNGNIFSVKTIDKFLTLVTVEYLTSIKGTDGTSVASVVCVKGNNSEDFADVNNEDGAINYYRIKDNNNNFLEGTIAIKNGSSGSGDDSSDSDGEFVDIDIPFEEDESGKFVIIDDSADENIGLILDSEGVKSKDFITSSNISLNDVGDRLSVVEDSIGIEQITYDNLVQLRNDKLLIPGKKYRITDYVTTTTQENTQSAGHQFDIIVTALTENELSEIASACYHEENYNEDNLENLYISEFNSEYGWNGGGCAFTHSGIRYIDGNIYIEYEDNNNNILIFDFNDKSKIYFDSSDVIKFIPSYYIAPDYGYNDLTENNVSLLGDDGFYVPYISTYDNMVDGNETQISISIRKEFNRNYFKNLGCNLSAWKIWYSLDNSDRFAWADVENGKGVIYRMIDEWGNDCPYDFKNIQFIKTTDDEIIKSYTFSLRKEITIDMSSSISKGIDIKDTSIAGNNGLLLNFGGNIAGVHNNVIKPYIPLGESENNKQYLNNICFCGYGVKFRGYNNNSFSNNCYNNVFGDNCNNNTFGNNCHNNIFGNGCYYNTLGDTCSSNTFGISCYNNTFGNHSYSNTLGDSCGYNTFGKDCGNNTFDITCKLNTFGNGCNNNTFGISFCYNTFGNQCVENTFGNQCMYNTFDNGCMNNTFGTDCYYNTLGSCCTKIIFGNSESTPSSYYRNIIIDNGNRYINLNCTSTTSSSKYYQNVRIGLGVNNTIAIKTINDPNVNQKFETLYKPANSQTITI
jgi:peptidoglycan hydrolase CwlO-like protein